MCAGCLIRRLESSDSARKQFTLAQRICPASELLRRQTDRRPVVRLYRRCSPSTQHLKPKHPWWLWGQPVVAKEHRRCRGTVSGEGETLRDASFTANFSSRHCGLRVSHARPNRDPPFRPHGSPCEPFLIHKKRLIAEFVFRPLEEEIYGFAFWRKPISDFGEVSLCQCILGFKSLNALIVPCCVHNAARAQVQPKWQFQHPIQPVFPFDRV